MTRSRRRRLLRRLEILFWSAAFVLLGAYALVYLDRSVYQSYAEWSFERKILHEPAPVIGFLLHSIRFGNSETAPASAEPPHAFENLRGGDASAVARPAPAGVKPSAPGDLIGRIEIPRLGVRAIVVEGTSDSCLRRAAGHIEGTALPGHLGNVGIAAHRDTFFRGLRKIRRDDIIKVTTLAGTYEYSVESIRIVEPDDVEVLGASAQPTLTLVTCFPFDYLGSAPHRFIVRARQIGEATPPQPPRGS